MILVPKKNAYGLDWCAYWEDFLTDHELNFLINHNQWHQQEPARIGGSMENNTDAIDNNIRRTSVAWFDFSENNLFIWKKLSDVIAEVNSRFFQINISECAEPMQLTTYTSDNKDWYDWHTDMAPFDRSFPRKLSMVLMLSDTKDFEGGELQIKIGSNEQTLQMKKGRAWFFPSYILHRVTPVTKGVRKTAVLWASGLQWK